MTDELKQFFLKSIIILLFFLAVLVVFQSESAQERHVRKCQELIKSQLDNNQKALLIQGLCK